MRNLFWYLICNKLSHFHLAFSRKWLSSWTSFIRCGGVLTLSIECWRDHFLLFLLLWSWSINFGRFIEGVIVKISSNFSDVNVLLDIKTSLNLAVYLIVIWVILIFLKSTIITDMAKTWVVIIEIKFFPLNNRNVTWALIECMHLKTICLSNLISNLFIYASIFTLVNWSVKLVLLD